MPAPTLECRLLSACNCSYGIDGNGVFTAPAPHFDAAGFTAAPTPIVGGVDNINAALVGASGDGIVVAFRGTLVADVHDLPSLLDWAQDFEAALISVPGIPGEVHSGFWRGLDTIWQGVLTAVNACRATGGDMPVYITGHSKGGGFAHLAAMRLQAAGVKPAEVYTYGSPRVGNADFCAAYDQSISAYRYKYMDDIVPHLPLDPTVAAALENLPFLGQQFRSLPVFDYANLGTLRFINWDDQIVGDSNMLQTERILHFATLVVRGQFSDFTADHSASCGGGYMTQVCPGVCPAG